MRRQSESKKNLWACRTIGTFAVLLFGAGGPAIWAGEGRATASGDSEHTVTRMVDKMLAERAAGEAGPYLTHHWGTFDLDRAYHIQSALDGALENTLGPVVGYKVAYASAAAQAQFGVDEPARGTFFLAQQVPAGSTVKQEDFLEILLETEVAFTLKTRISQPVATVDALKAHVRWIHPALDVGNFRFVPARDGRKGTVQDMVASGTGAHYFVLGPGMDPSTLEPAALTLKLHRDGEEIRASAAAEVMGDPWNSLLWCVNDVIKRGGEVRPGTIILTGTAAPAYRATGSPVAGVYRGDCGALGAVTLVIE